MIPQHFKGDATELKMQEVVEPIFDQTNAALNEFYENAFTSAAFLLMLYDAGRMPFSERINRDAFIQFITQAFANFPVIGTFESYIFILQSIFGLDSDITFTVHAAGKLNIDVNAYSELTFGFIARELVGGVYIYYDMVDFENDPLVLRGVAGIQTQYELELLFSEIMPAGIFPTITLDFVGKFFWISEESGDSFEMVDISGNQIIFYELGG